MRLFVGLDIPEAIRTAIANYVDELRRVAPDAKWVRPESYHVTLKFIGEWRRDVREVTSELDQIEAPSLDVSFRNCGFFPNAKAPRVFWIGIAADSKLPSLAVQVDRACSAFGIESEDREYSPHLTLARSGSGSPRPKRHEPLAASMKRLAERIAGIQAPDFGTMHATEFFLYESKLSPGGAKYIKLKSFRLGD
ncbi:MAG TPA: RNA 2',3'-cyclic phosphodiesterase [Terriglobales bacterium]|nr:RNA 2',3'-cyclic phosphodiesterase [Terriglobales bacterium]